MNIVLIGYRGTGKSTVGRLLAQRLGWTFLDADEELERRAGRTIREIFATGGEPAFRDLESAILTDLLAQDGLVLALGGGAVLRDGNRRVIRSPGNRVVWLQAGAETLFQRICADPTTAERRPLLTAAGGTDEIVRLLAVREHFYRECAEFLVDTEGKEADEVAAEIVSLLS